MNVTLIRCILHLRISTLRLEDLLIYFKYTTNLFTYYCIYQIIRMPDIFPQCGPVAWPNYLF